MAEVRGLVGVYGRSVPAYDTEPRMNDDGRNGAERT